MPPKKTINIRINIHFDIKKPERNPTVPAIKTIMQAQNKGEDEYKASVIETKKNLIFCN